MTAFVLRRPGSRPVLRGFRGRTRLNDRARVTLVLAVLIVIANLVVDVLHRALDPRLREAAYARA
jgi:hypothetical protein